MSYNVVVKMINIKAGVPQNVFRTRGSIYLLIKLKKKSKI